MTAETLLTRLDRVKSTGRGRWIARCPAHDDGRPSLSVRELADGRVLLHDFGGCATSDVLAALGLDVADLFPEKIDGHGGRRERDPHNVRDVLLGLADEALIVAVAAIRAGTGQRLTDDERHRLITAAVRIINGADLFRATTARGRRAFIPKRELREAQHAA